METAKFYIPDHDTSPNRPRPLYCCEPGDADQSGEYVRAEDARALLEFSSIATNEALTRVRTLNAEVARLRDWKESAMSVMPSFQEIGKELGVPLGGSVSDRILPGIVGLKAENARLKTQLAEIHALAELDSGTFGPMVCAIASKTTTGGCTCESLAATEAQLAELREAVAHDVMSGFELSTKLRQLAGVEP
jgi:outer membrane murein-binding lipoprotein Lpp